MALDQDDTSLATISLLESRLLRIEKLVYGSTSPASEPLADSALQRLVALEKSLASLTSRTRVYGELLRIHQTGPDLFHDEPSSVPPSQLSIESIRSIVLASAAAFPATVSSLAAMRDSPVPEAWRSVSLASLSERMKALEATQMAQAAQVAELRGRSEAVIRLAYERNILAPSNLIADAEYCLRKAEREVRRRERVMEDESQL